jgi:phosphatidate cytidylyltransferase
MMKKIYGNKYIIYCLFGVGYITMPVLMMLDLRRSFGLFEGAEHFQDADLSIPLCIIFSIWINDTMAYIVGSLIGKTALAKISPKKTWEGTIGGILLSVIFIGFLYPVLMGKYLQPFIPVKAWFIIAAISAIFGTLGDLLESKLKRMADVKDSGSFMPGHGGFLDRFDSLLVGVPFVWLYVKVFL